MFRKCQIFLFFLLQLFTYHHTKVQSYLPMECFARNSFIVDLKFPHNTISVACCSFLHILHWSLSYTTLEPFTLKMTLVFQKLVLDSGYEVEPGCKFIAGKMGRCWMGNESSNLKNKALQCLVIQIDRWNKRLETPGLQQALLHLILNYYECFGRACSGEHI